MPERVAPARSRPSASVLLTTYENPRALELVLTGLEMQTVRDFEIWVADDGSGPATRRVVERFAASSRLPVEHVWHEDRGFRKMQILNQVLPRARADYVVLLEGDCVPHPGYVESHLRFRAPATFLYGHRVFLGARVSGRLTPDRLRRGGLGGALSNLRRWALLDARRPYNALRLPPAGVSVAQQLLRITRPVMRGMNFSTWTEDLLAINGWNEDYDGWGREDDDLVARLQFRGLRGRSVRFGAILYHLHHPIRSRAQLPENDRIFREVVRRRSPVCVHGVQRLDGAGEAPAPGRTAAVLAVPRPQP